MRVSPKKSTIQQITVPNFFLAFYRLYTAEWLELTDHDEEGALDRFVSQNVNLSLVSALLFTSFMPIYYTEATRINVDGDGLATDVFSGYVASLSPLALSSNAVHDIFDTSYVVATASSLFGTLVAVVFSMAGAMAGSDAKVIAMKKGLGKFAVLPYYFLTISFTGWAVGVWLHIVVVPRTLAGLVIKVVVIAVLIVVLLVCLPVMVRSLFTAVLEERKHPPIVLTEEEITVMMEEYFTGKGENSVVGRTRVKDLSLKEALMFLRGEPVSSGYHIPMSEPTVLLAKKVYCMRLAREMNVTFDQAIALNNMQ